MEEASSKSGLLFFEELGVFAVQFAFEIATGIAFSRIVIAGVDPAIPDSEHDALSSLLPIVGCGSRAYAKSSGRQVGRNDNQKHVAR